MTGVGLLVAVSLAFAQPPMFTDGLPKEEFAARRATVMKPVEPSDLETLMAEPGFAAKGTTIGSGSAPRDR